MLQLGIDPSSKPGEHHAALWDGSQCIAAGRVFITATGYVAIDGEVYYMPDAVIIETPDPDAGTFTANGKTVRSRTGAITRMYHEALTLARQFAEAGCAVWIPSADVIRRQAGWNPRKGGKADAFVTRELYTRGVLAVWAGTWRAADPIYLRNGHNRDACMAAMFNTGEINKQYKYEVKE